MTSALQVHQNAFAAEPRLQTHFWCIWSARSVSEGYKSRRYVKRNPQIEANVVVS